jgi:site-specific DNA recombinase
MKRCAIYTRKSSDEGLDQHFNSLDAQREACEAYVLSQAGEGWSALTTRYDDGGFSGGSMERPALQRLLADLGRGLIDVVVVYKIDRLTRSLADFARIVERLDAKEASFVSVTQAFNTTTSMGRLTLNVLLSFAQFEREVTGERIRDKIAASKAKGLWMGGLPPFGYDVPTNGTRVLQVNEAEAGKVRHIFERYLALRSVHRLVDELKRDGVRSKARLNRKGETTGAQPFGRGALFHLLKNRIYVGEIVHKGTCHPGQHEGIVDQNAFDRAQALLSRQRKERRKSTIDRSPFVGKLFDSHGFKLTQTHSQGASGRSYRYYVPAHLQQGQRATGKPRRYAAKQVDEIISSALLRIGGCNDPPEQLVRAELSPHSIELILRSNLLTRARHALEVPEHVAQEDNHLRWTIPAVLRSRGGRAKIHSVHHDSPQRDAILIKGLRAAHRLVRKDRDRLAIIEAMPQSRYAVRLMRLAFLSPSIQRDILAGRQPPWLRLEDLVRVRIPLCWKAQERLIRRLSTQS